MTDRLETPTEVVELRSTLHDIADKLGVPIGAFTDEYGAEERELLGIWSALSSEDRERLLERARDLARGGASVA